MIDERIQVSEDGSTVWVFSWDGSTVGRFSKKFGIDLHRTVTEQMSGLGQCLHCTHTAPLRQDWLMFCENIKAFYDIDVPIDLVSI